MNPNAPFDSRSPRTDGVLTLDQALTRSEPLARLSERLRDSTARFEAIRPLLPPVLAAHVQPGPVDDEGWSLLAANAAVASKLRQLKPRLEERLREGGWRNNAIRVKIASNVSAAP